MDRVIISCFRRTVGFDLFFTTQNQLFEEHTDFRFHCLFAKIHHTQSGKGIFFFEIPIWERLLFFGDSHFENLSASKSSWVEIAATINEKRVHPGADAVRPYRHILLYDPLTV